jgi:tRNA (guanine26-N2/guanine27-N2)-dimethyltransferase
MKEEKIEFDIGKVFYNPNMQFNRSFSSLAVGALEGKLSAIDAFSASGIRGMRYKKENKNVKEIAFLDANDQAMPLLKKNLRKNKIKADAIKKPYEKYFTSGFFFYDLIEVDPFGSPVPHLWSTFYGQQKKKEFYLSVTATDVAVLCGPAAKACLKNYHSKSLNNEFTHEVGTRILVKRIAEAANEFNFAVTPLFSLSDRHYIKLLLKVERGGDKADENQRNLGFVSYCNICGWRKTGKRTTNKCENCKKETDYAGPLWLGELHDKKFLGKMLKLNEKRDYDHRDEIRKTLRLMIGECGMPAFYYDIHLAGKRLKKSSPKMDALLAALKKKGFSAARTHFAELGIKTDAGLRELVKTV